MLDITNKQAVDSWEQYVENIRKATALSNNETPAQKKKRIATLEADPEAWFIYYFPNYSYAEPADFHKAATKRVIKNAEWYEVRAWSRELAKSTRSMMEWLYLSLTGKKRYLLMISNTESNAIRLLEPFRANLEANQRIINDYGPQMMPGSWTAGEFTTRKGVAYRALGWGQSPRGTRNEEVRPDGIFFDDIDTDEECRNDDIMIAKWSWIEDAAMATRSVSRDLLVLFLGNVISENCTIKKAMEFADKVSTINIRDANGKSTWSKNTEANIDRVLSKKSYASQQKEYFNNPISEGQIFKELKYGKCPPLKSLKFAIIYADPATSNKDKPSVKSKMQNSTKFVGVIGTDGFNYYIYKVWLDHTTNAKFIDNLFEATEYAERQGALVIYTYIENNTLQDPFYEQVFIPLINAKGKEKGRYLSITPDIRQKPEKFFRIEAKLEPLNRSGRMVMNEKEKDDPAMKRLDTQFRAVSPNSKVMDGPDGVEGGVHKAEEKILVIDSGGIKSYRRPANNKRM